MDGLLVHGRGRDAAVFQDAVDLLLLDRPRRERPAGVSVSDEGCEGHGVWRLGGEVRKNVESMFAYYILPKPLALCCSKQSITQ